MLARLPCDRVYVAMSGMRGAVRWPSLR
jgi:hypothetical protein